MSEDQTQETTEDTAAEADDATKASDGADARDDDGLDAALAEYEAKGTSKAAEQSQTEQTTDTKPSSLEASVKELVEDKRARDRQSIAQDMAEAVKQVRGDVSATAYDDAMVEGWLNARAEQDPRVQQAWLDRHKNPVGFQRVLKGLSKDFAKGRATDVDAETTADRDAVTAAVRGATSSPPAEQQPEFGPMANNEYADSVEKKYGYRPAV